MATVNLVTGKSATFTYGTTQGEAQITTFNPSASKASESVETLGGSAPQAGSEEYTVTVSFLFDGNVSGGGFYKAVRDAYEAESPGTITFTIGTYSETGSALPTDLTMEAPADGAVTCEATFLCTGMTPTYPTTP